MPLKKLDDGTCPVGIGETLRRIIGKSGTNILKQDILLSSGSLQTCAGMQSGVEAAIHATKKSFDNDDCEGFLLIDADNAFYRLNQEVSLRNIKQLYPPLYKYLDNSYNTPTKLYLKDGSYILKQEDNTAMAMYAISSRPPIETLSNNNKEVRQVWFVDDAAENLSI